MDKPETEYDLTFTLKQGTTVKNAIAALADPSFNPSALAKIEVDQDALGITVRVTDPQTQKQAFGFLRLEKDGLKDFVCEKPFVKLVSLTSIHNILDEAAAEDKKDCDSIAVFVESGINQLSFIWGEITLTSLASGLPEKSVPLYDLTAYYGMFPDVSYGFEAVIASSTLNNTITEVLQIDPDTRPTHGLVTMTEATVDIKLRDGVVVSTVGDPETHVVRMEWKYWESLQKALRLADNCSMLLADPPESIMFHFKLQELGNLFYLTSAEIKSVRELPKLDS